MKPARGRRVILPSGTEVMYPFKTESSAKRRGKVKGKKKSKYNNKWTVVNGIKFQSIGEGKRYAILLQLQDLGVISDLKTQVKFPLIADGGKLVGHYCADFTYTDCGSRVVEDYKGMKTTLYKFKARFFKAQYGFAILETGKEDLVLTVRRRA